MAGDPHRRLESIMSKLSQSALPRAKKPLIPSDGIGRRKEASGVRVLRSTMGSFPQCRPWDRGDLMRRLATFKAMTWFGKPKAVSPVNCARRGWINVEMDVICCEACEVRLLFSTPSSWNLQQVEKAAAVFSLKLDNGHKSLCPWIDNACDEKLALFPPAPPPALVDSYKERSVALLKLTSLPVISSSTVSYMKSPQLESFLSQSLFPPITFNNGIRFTDNPSGKDLMGALENTAASIYYQAQKIISLCGWEPCLLPYAVDSEDRPSESVGEILGEKSSSKKSSSTIVYTSRSGEVGENNSHPSLGENQYDPGSVVLDCKFCGARVGLWAFETVQCPLEYFTLIADPDLNESATRCTNPIRSLDAPMAESSGKDHQDTSKESTLGFNLTIAGGPPPTKQNFRPVVSFPIVSRHLRVEIASVYCKDYSSSLSGENHENAQFHLQNDVSSQQQMDLNGDVDARSLKRKRNEKEVDVSENDHVNDPSHSKEEFQVLGNGLKTGEKLSGFSFESKRDYNTQEVHSSHGGTDDNVNSEEVTHYTDEESHRSNINSDGTGRNIVHMESAITDSVEDRRVSLKASNANVFLRNCDASGNNSVLELGDIHNSNDGTPLNRVRTSEDDRGDPLDIASCSAANAALSTGNSMDTEIANTSSIFKNHPIMKAREQNTNGWERMLPPAKMDAKDDPDFGNIRMQKLHNKICEFDPIRQHRPFCPWIAPETGESLPGWRLTLNALVQQKKESSSDQQQLDSSSTLIDEGDDPIVSIRKLFMSPPTKRLKGSH